MKSSIAIIGTASSGKTVLLTVLAQRNKNSCMQPDNLNTFQFQEEKWELLNKGMWPAPTPPQKKNRLLEWFVSQTAQSRSKTKLRTADVGGEAWDQFIKAYANKEGQDGVTLQNIKDTVHQYKPEWYKNLPAEIAPEALLNSASGICILVNLKENINNTESGKEQKDFVWAVCNYLDKIKKNCPVAEVLTQRNTYGEEWEKVYERDFASIKYPYRRIITDAVADTHFDRREHLSKPSPNFSSIGIDSLMNWIKEVVKKDRKKRAIFRGIEIFCWILAFIATSFCIFIPLDLIMLLFIVGIILRLIIPMFLRFQKK